MDPTQLLKQLEEIANVADVRAKQSILEACQQWLLDSNDSTVDRPLLEALPSLCSSLFGASGGLKTGILQRVLHPHERRLWQAFLAPSAPLVARLLRLHGDTKLQYRISIDNLPASTRRALASSDWSGIAAIYRDRIADHGPAYGTESLAAAALGVSSAMASGSGGLVRSAADQPKRVLPNMLFNMFEYYMFCLAFTVRLVQVDSVNIKTYPSTQHGAVSRFPVSVAAPVAKAPAYNYPPSLDLAYYDIIKELLAFFVPKKPLVVEFGPSSFVTPRKTSASQRRMFDAGQDGVSRSGNAVRRTMDLQNNGASPVAAGADAGNGSASKDVFSSRDVDSVGRALLASEFVFSIFVELWLCPCESSEKATVTDVSQPAGQRWAFEKPKVAQIRCIGLLIDHLKSLDLRRILTENQVSQFKAEMSEFRKEEAYDVAKAVSYRSLRVRLFPFLKAALEQWPLDDSIEDVINIWLAYITPWTGTGGAFSDEWGPFVKDNFVYYTILLQTFLNKAHTLSFTVDLRSATRSTQPPSSRSSTMSAQSPSTTPLLQSTTSQRRSIDIIEMVVKVFSDPGLLELLRVMETALSTLDTFSLGGGVSDPMTPRPAASATTAVSGTFSGFNTPVNRSPRMRNQLLSGSRNQAAGHDAATDRLYTYQNSGPTLRSHILSFDPSGGTYRPIFIRDRLDSAEAQWQLQQQQQQQYQGFGQSQAKPQPSSTANVQKLAIALAVAADRIAYKKERAEQGLLLPPTPSLRGRTRSISSSTPLMGGPGTPRTATRTTFAGPDETPSLQQGSLLGTVLSFIIGMFDSSVSTQAATEPPLTREQLAKCDADMARIAKILDLIARTWNLDLDTDVHAKIDPFRRSGSDTALNQDEAERVPVAPGVYAPETLGDSANLLTRRGREQIRKGWRKSTAEDVNVIPSSRARRVISSEDSPLLVSIALLLAYATDASARFLHGFTTWIPLVRSEPFWRESMSSWQRLLRSLILLLVAFIVLAIVWLVFKILGYMFFSSPQPAASSVGAGNRVRPGGNAQPTYGRSGQAYVGSGGHGYQAYNPNRFV